MCVLCYYPSGLGLFLPYWGEVSQWGLGPKETPLTLTALKNDCAGHELVRERLGKKCESIATYT